MSDGEENYLDYAKSAISEERWQTSIAFALIALVEEIQGMRIDIQNVDVALQNLQRMRGRVN